MELVANKDVPSVIGEITDVRKVYRLRRKILQLANDESNRFNHEYIGTEHILLGLVSEGTGVATKILSHLGIDPHKIRLEVEKLMPSGPDAVIMGKRPQTPRAKKIIEYAMEETRSLNHDFLGSEHILLGILHDKESVASVVLTNAGVTLESARAQALLLIAEGVSDPPRAQWPRREGPLGIASKTPTVCPHCSRPYRFRWRLAPMNFLRRLSGIVARTAAPLANAFDRRISRANTPTRDYPWVTRSAAMYERFTDRARKVMQLANQEAQRFNHEYIGTEHILLGLIKEGSGVAANVLKNLDVDLRTIRLAIEKLVQSGPDMVTMGKLPQTPRTKEVIEYSMDEARNLNHNYVGTEHILLGLLREPEGVAAQVLMNLGLKLENVRAEIMALLGPAMSDHTKREGIETIEKPSHTIATNDYPWMSWTVPMHEHFTDRAGKVMQIAKSESQRYNSEYIGTEHILLGLVKAGNGVAAKVLQKLQIDLDNIRMEVEKLVQSGPEMVTTGKLSPTPQAGNVIRYSMEEARILDCGFVGTGHILVGLLREREGVAAHVLNKCGVKLVDVRARILSLLAPPTLDHTKRDGDERIEELDEVVAELPAVCPKCGQSRIVRVLWNWVHLWGQKAEDVRSGKALLGSRSGGTGPPWVCLECVPEWSEVHRLSTLEWQWLLAKEAALTSGEFEKAELCRDAQDEVRQRLLCVVDDLLKTQ